MLDKRRVLKSVVAALLLTLLGMRANELLTTNTNAAHDSYSAMAEQLSQVTIDSYPLRDIAIVTINGEAFQTPHTISQGYGSILKIEIRNLQQTLDGKTYYFDHWIELNEYDFYSQAVKFSYQVPSRGYVRLEAVYISDDGVPWHSQYPNDCYCGPASLEMAFDYLGPDIPQSEIALVGKTSSSGTNGSNLRRAAHFSSLSTEGDLHGYSARSLGYAAFEYSASSSWLDGLKSLVNQGYTIVVSTRYSHDSNSRHLRVVVGYDGTTVRLHDPWDPVAFNTGAPMYGGPFLMMRKDVFEGLWANSSYWALIVSPWIVNIEVDHYVNQSSSFWINATITYPCPAPFDASRYPSSSTQATLSLPQGFSLASGETPTINIGSFAAGQTRHLSWQAIASGSSSSFSIGITVAGTISESGYPYSYTDRIGGSNNCVVEVVPGPTVHGYSPIIIMNGRSGLHQSATGNLGNLGLIPFCIAKAPTFSMKKKKRRTIAVLVSTIGMVIAVSVSVLALFGLNVAITNRGEISYQGVLAYFDESHSIPAYEIDWGNMVPGSSSQATMTVRNIGHVRYDVSLVSSNLSFFSKGVPIASPSAISDCMILTCSPTEYSLDPTTDVNCNLCLSLSANTYFSDYLIANNADTLTLSIIISWKTI